MQRTTFADIPCSIARTLDVFGEPWTPLILRDVWIGMTRFEQIRSDLGISTKVLTQRLGWLVESGVLERRQYSQRPPRYEYALTEKGIELCDVLLVMRRWGDKWLAGEQGPPVLHRHRACGKLCYAQLHCSECGNPMHVDDVEVMPGPALDPLQQQAMSRSPRVTIGTVQAAVSDRKLRPSSLPKPK